MVIRERINHQITSKIKYCKQLFKKGDCVTISDFLEEDLVIFLETSNRDDALNHLVKALHKTKKLEDQKQFFDAILRREKIVSTGIGMGVAIPHAKLENFDDFFIAVGVYKEGKGIEWDSLDGAPVRLIFMIGGPVDKQTEYLKILSRLTSAIKDNQRREKLLLAQTSSEVIGLFKQC